MKEGLAGTCIYPGGSTSKASALKSMNNCAQSRYRMVVAYDQSTPALLTDEQVLLQVQWGEATT